VRLIRLRLRGFIGIRDGMGLEEIDLSYLGDLDGLVALAGPNGSGKSTILENLHPYRTMRTKPGSLLQQVYLKDSLKELLWEFDGTRYRSVLNLDPTSGKSKAYLYRFVDGEGEVPVCDGG
jgi:exonuclease SbcC